MAHLVLTPAGPGRFAASLDGTPVVTGRTPFLAAARALLDCGRDPSEPLTASHAGSPTVALRSTIGAAAALTVDEGDASLRFAPFRDGLAEFPGRPAEDGRLGVGSSQTPGRPQTAAGGLDAAA